jgi:hypothetical protein
VAVKLWRLGRVARHEADLIDIAQDKDEVLSAHERAAERAGSTRKVRRADIPTRADLEDAKREVDEAKKVLTNRDEALRLLEGRREPRPRIVQY